MLTIDQAANRRRFLRYLAASSVVAYGGGSRLAQALEAPSRLQQVGAPNIKALVPAMVKHV